MSLKVENTKPLLLNILQSAEAACTNGDYSNADKLYTKAIQLNENNPSLYGNRSVVKFYLQDYTNALKDAQNAIRIDPGYVVVRFHSS